MNNLNFEYNMYAATDKGIVRAANEDAISLVKDSNLIILADGMGGHNAGEIASAIAVDFLTDTLPKITVKNLRQEIIKKIQEVNDSILQVASRKPIYNGMGTTLVIAWFIKNRLITAHLGDSRVYRVRNNMITRITKDHSLIQEQIDSGLITEDQGEQFFYKNVITRALGIDEIIMPELTESEVTLNDIFIICSDGLSDMLSDDEIKKNSCNKTKC